MDALVSKFNMARGIISEGVSPKKLVNYLVMNPELITLYEDSEILKNTNKNWLFILWKMHNILRSGINQ